MTLETYANTVNQSTDGQSIQTAGINFIESIHQDINSQNINDVRRKVASDPKDVISVILLNLLTSSEPNELEEIQNDKEKLAFTVNPT
jgi:hypothetical protein